MISQGPVEDRLAIRELVESYNDAVMRFDGDAWRENWAEEASWTLPGAGEISGLDNFYPIWEQTMATFSFVGFFASAGPIVVEGDEAKGTWYQQEFLDGKDGSRRAITGRYDDRYVRRNGRWYFLSRVYNVLKASEETA